MGKIAKVRKGVEAKGLAVPPPMDPTLGRAVSIEREHKPIYNVPAALKEEKISLMEYLLRKAEGAAVPVDGSTKEHAAPPNQGVTLGRKYQPFNMRGMAEFQSSNPHHSSCIQTKKYSTVGLGFRSPDQQGKVPAGGSILNSQMQQTVLAQNKDTPPNPDGTASDKAIDPEAMSAAIRQRQALTKADKILNPLTSHTFMDVMLLISEDYHQVGNGYMEVVRAAGDGKITGLHHIPAADVFPWIENNHYDFHYEILGEEGAGGSRHFARWGDTKAFIKRNGEYSAGWFGIDKATLAANTVSEVISFKNPSSRNRWYGFPDWLACVSSIELIQCLHQYMYDFFLNRGVPEFIFILSGAKMLEQDWTKVENALKGNIGLANSHKSVALNLPNKDIVVTLEKLAMEGNSEGTDFAAKKDCLALDIVSAHRVPPLLAGIQIPGKLGANNELPNALMAFQVLVIGPTQRKFTQTLAMTLGNKEQNGGLDLTEDDFLFRTVTEEIDVGTLDTQARMRTPVVQAKAEGRDLKDGLKKGE